MAEPPTIRPMTDDDLDPAVELMIDGGWGNRRRFLQFALDHPGCVPFVGELEDRIAGTGVATVNGPVGWIGMIFVDEALRGRGLGTALTEAVIGELERAGCRSFALIASPYGQPIYERLGFATEVAYRVLAAPGRGGTATSSAGTDASTGDPGRLRPFSADDLDAVLALDREATGEDRGHLLRESLGAPGATIALEPDGRIGGFEASAPWGTHPAIAFDTAAGVRLLEARRTRTAVGSDARTAIPATNRVGLTALENLGWQAERELVRMVRGAPVAWRPSAVWGQFNFAMG
jgi:GNAT superfamily N-acetyltransferase